MIDERVAQRMTLSRRGRRDLAWQLRYEGGWTLVRIGRRLGVDRAAVSRLLRCAASAEQSTVSPRVTPHSAPAGSHHVALIRVSNLNSHIFALKGNEPCND